MQIAIVGAGFSPGEADQLRRAMATFRHTGTIHTFREKFVGGMVKNGYEAEFAERCFKQIEGFGEYGFPESHAASFALLVYVSAWLKCHYPDAFCAAILNSQPMGFYQPSQLVRDAREHGVEVRAVDVNASDWDCTLEPATAGKWRAVRLGLRQVNGMPEAHARALVAARGAGYTEPRALWARGGVPVAQLVRLAEADAFRSLGLDRRGALWAVKGLEGGALQRKAAAMASAAPMFAIPPDDLFHEAAVTLPAMTLGEHVVEDYTATGLSLKAHPCGLFRSELRQMGVITSAQHREAERALRRVSVAGLVLVRQRPGTAKGVVFMTLEDEFGVVNVVVWAKVFATHRRVVTSAKFLLVRGRIQREGEVIHVVAETFVDLSSRLNLLSQGEARPASLSVPDGRAPAPKSRDFH